MSEFRILRAALEAHGACSGKHSGLELFDERVAAQGHGGTDLVYPEGWTRETASRIANETPLFYSWLLHHELIPDLGIPRPKGEAAATAQMRSWLRPRIGRGV